jgi:phospholipase/lecithinase/hemolysin
MKEYSTAVNAIFTYRIPYEVALANRYPGASFALYDVHALFKDIYYNPKAYLNGTTAANVTGFYHHCTDYSHCVDETKQDKDSFLWYDELHPSQRADQIVASNFFDVVKGKSKWATYW